MNEIKLKLIQKYFKTCSNLDTMEEDYLFVDQIDSDNEVEAEFDAVPEDIAKAKSNEYLKLSDNEVFLSSYRNGTALKNST